jgi:hypothetical protein
VQTKIKKKKQGKGKITIMRRQRDISCLNVMTSSLVTQAAELQAWYFIQTTRHEAREFEPHHPVRSFRRPEGDYRVRHHNNPLITNGKLRPIDSELTDEHVTKIA